MKNKKNKTPQPHQPTAVKASGITKTGWKIIAAGILVLIAGYFVLSKTDPAGQNWASTLSPFLILGGYAIIGIGIIFPGKK
jgi:Protein of unknown function (DUF3098).